MPLMFIAQLASGKNCLHTDKKCKARMAKRKKCKNKTSKKWFLSPHQSGAELPELKVAAYYCE